MSGDSQPNYQSLLQRGELLRDQRRYAESEKFLQEAIALQPASADAYYELAFCYCNWDGHEAKGLETIDRAISLEPNRSEFFALRAWILGNLNRNKEAILTADQALELNPQNVLALNAQTRAYNDLHNWPQTEIHARRVLQINARNELAANFLSISLRQQGRLQESRAVTTGLLGQSPDNALTQSNAGWSALQEGDYRGANQHFLEALRLNPNYENARAGLLHSFNSRVWIYRLYFQFIARIGRYRKEMRILFLVIVYVGYRVVLTELRTRFGREGIHWALVVIALYLIVFGFGRSFGNLFLLLDPFARHALTGKEKGWSLFAGFVFGALLVSLITDNAWLQASVLLAILAFFLWGVMQPRFQDAFARASDSSAENRH